jgi:DNA-binding NtrC family response regulator
MNWPGNVRQLKHVIERTVLIAGKDVLEADDFALAIGMEAGAAQDPLPSADAMTMEEIEKNMIAKCMKQYGGKISRVAEALGMTRQALYRRLEKYGIAP